MQTRYSTICTQQRLLITASLCKTRAKHVLCCVLPCIFLFTVTSMNSLSFLAYYTWNSTSCKGDSLARLVNGQRADWTLVTQHLDEGFSLVGRPQADRAVMVAQVYDGVVRVLTHHVQPSGLGADGCHLFAHRHVEILQETRSTLVKGEVVWFFLQLGTKLWHQHKCRQRKLLWFMLINHPIVEAKWHVSFVLQIYQGRCVSIYCLSMQQLFFSTSKRC